MNHREKIIMNHREKIINSKLRSLVAVVLILFGPWLSPPFVKGADTVLYYHNDALGSPVAMTNSGGTVIWNVDYGPFGDEVNLNESPNLPNSHRFIGKETDVETGLHNLGARYYDPGIGRFLSVDPALLHGHPKSALNTPFGLNLYSYSFDNPYRFSDSSGKWPTHIWPVHQMSINRVLSQLSLHDLSILTRQQVIIDADQSSEMAYQHAMRDGRDSSDQSATRAWELANGFIAYEIFQARQSEASFIETGNQFDHDTALMHVSNAIHTAGDSTSPEHAGFQPWDQHESWLKKMNHIIGESYDPGSGSALDIMTRKIWDIYKSDGPIQSEILPKP
ncbi:MAG: RHS domain-containing protein [Nitrospirae bacterium]|nr:RHS domain-containing protein [Nitrospirota bacterium]